MDGGDDNGQDGELSLEEFLVSALTSVMVLAMMPRVVSLLDS